MVSESEVSCDEASTVEDNRESEELDSTYDSTHCAIESGAGVAREVDVDLERQLTEMRIALHNVRQELALSRQQGQSDNLLVGSSTKIINKRSIGVISRGEYFCRSSGSSK